MKKINYLGRLVIVAMACSFAAGAPIEARSGDNARLIINRSADFGVNESVNLRIDGVSVAVLGVNQSYDMALSPGRHVLSITTNPANYKRETPAPVTVNAEPGKTYAFTAVWDDSDRASLAQPK